MPRYAARKDQSQKAIVRTLEALGCSVRILPSINDSLPDLLVGLMDRLTFVVEVKNPDTADDLTSAQEQFWALWHGNPKIVLTSRDDALAFVEMARAQE